MESSQLYLYAIADQRRDAGVSATGQTLSLVSMFWTWAYTAFRGILLPRTSAASSIPPHRRTLSSPEHQKTVCSSQPINRKIESNYVISALWQPHSDAKSKPLVSSLLGKSGPRSRPELDLVARYSSVSVDLSHGDFSSLVVVVEHLDYRFGGRHNVSADARDVHTKSLLIGNFDCY